MAEENEARCCHCASNTAELRPYGPGGAWLCFPCMKASPEREAEAGRQFAAQLEAAGPVAVATRHGPVPHRDYGRKLS